MTYWQFKISNNAWKNDNIIEYQKLSENNFEYPQKALKNKMDNRIGDIVFHYNSAKSKKHPTGIYLISKIISNVYQVNGENKINLVVIKDLKNNPYNYQNDFKEIHEYYNTTKHRKRSQTYEIIDNSYNPQRLYDLIMSNERDTILAEELNQEESKVLNEGAKKEIIVNAYERSSQARKECIEHYGTKCQVCDFDFEEIYGEIGKEFIHVHHLIEISSIAQDYEVNPIEDLRPVCPNCHAMLHKKRPAYSIDELKNMI